MWWTTSSTGEYKIFDFVVSLSSDFELLRLKFWAEGNYPILKKFTRFNKGGITMTKRMNPPAMNGQIPEIILSVGVNDLTTWHIFHLGHGNATFISRYSVPLLWFILGSLHYLFTEKKKEKRKKCRAHLDKPSGLRVWWCSSLYVSCSWIHKILCIMFMNHLWITFYKIVHF